MFWRKKKAKQIAPNIDFRNDNGRLVIKNSLFRATNKPVFFITENMINIHCMGYLFQYESPEFINRKVDTSKLPPPKCYKIIDGKITQVKHSELT